MLPPQMCRPGPPRADFTESRTPGGQGAPWICFHEVMSLPTQRTPAQVCPEREQPRGNASSSWPGGTPERQQLKNVRGEVKQSLTCVFEGIFQVLFSFSMTGQKEGGPEALASLGPMQNHWHSVLCWLWPREASLVKRCSLHVL